MNSFGMYGLIPACAGKTKPSRPRKGKKAAHPRVCGENSQRDAEDALSAGSSPRVRGKLSPAIRDLAPVGLIPACAGKTLIPTRPKHGGRAHPRVCGENCFYRFRVRGAGLIPACAGKTVFTVFACAALGSSPRVRGKRVVWFHARPAGGLIPACAGKTSEAHGSTSFLRAHPRVCGENLIKP